MKKRFNMVLILVGALILLGGLLLYGLSINKIIPIPRPDLLVLSAGVLGISLIVFGACEVFFKKTRALQIEENDERNIAIANAAKSTGFEVMTSLFSVALVALIFLELITTEVFFIFFAVFLISQAAFIARLWYLNSKM